jgi:hypothetical protein
VIISCGHPVFSGEGKQVARFRLVRRLGVRGDTSKWNATAQYKRVILEQAWNEDVDASVERIGGRTLHESVLELPVRRLVPANHPKMMSKAEKWANVEAFADDKPSPQIQWDTVDALSLEGQKAARPIDRRRQKSAYANGRPLPVTAGLRHAPSAPHP